VYILNHKECLNLAEGINEGV